MVDLLLFNFLPILPILLGALILLMGIGKPARLRTIIGYEIPVILLLPLALCIFGVWPYSSATEEIGYFGLSPLFGILLMALPAICASASALLRGRRGLLSGLIGAMLLLAEAALFAFSGRDGVLILLAYPLYLLFLCVLGFVLDKQLSANTDRPASAAAEASSQMTTAAVHAAQTVRKERSSNTMNPKLKPGSAIRRGVIGAAIGAVAMAILYIAIGGNFGNVLYGVFCGTLYGFGFAFANWRKILRNTKKATVEGAAGIGIGVILSRLTDDNNWGMLGWLYFLFRMVCALAFGWIPGIWYGIQAIIAELNEERASAPAENIRQSLASDANRSGAPTEAAPVLYCLSGAFAGAELPMDSGEVITLGSDPSRCQLVLTGEGIQPQHCQLGFDKETSGWYAVAVSDGKVYRDGIRPLNPESVTILPRGTVLSIGQGANSQRFRLG